jgi:hypothetical protein
LGFCQPSSYLCLDRCPAAASAVRACVALLSIMPIICGPILISSVSLPVAVLASAMCGIFCLRGPVLWLVSSYVATLLLLRAPARTAATGPLAPLVGAVALAARPGAVLVCFVNGCLQVCEICGRASSSVRARGARARDPPEQWLLRARALPVTPLLSCIGMLPFRRAVRPATHRLRLPVCLLHSVCLALPTGGQFVAATPFPMVCQGGCLPVDGS